MSPNGQSDKTSGDSAGGKETETQINQLGSLSGDHRRAGCPNTDPTVEGALEVDPNPEGLRAKPVSGGIYLHLVTSHTATKGWLLGGSPPWSSET